MHVLCVIPARLGSARLPHKPLRLIAGEPLIAHVARRVRDFALDLRIVVATDDPRVSEAVSGLDLESALTSSQLTSGTERVAAVLALPAFGAHDVILNVQGDEPLVQREAVVGALERVTQHGDQLGTAAAPLERGALRNPHRVKVTVDGRGRALGFFRTPGPVACARHQAVFQHVGVYAYQKAALRRWVALPRTPEETHERLEQLRPLAHGMTMGVAVQSAPAAPGVDTEHDLLEIERRLTVATWG